jgi:hypothetical protein
VAYILEGSRTATYQDGQNLPLKVVVRFDSNLAPLTRDPCYEETGSYGAQSLECEYEMKEQEISLKQLLILFLVYVLLVPEAQKFT